MSLPQTDSLSSLDVDPSYACWKRSAVVGIICGMLSLPLGESFTNIPGWKVSAVVGTIAGMLSVAAVEAITKTGFEILPNSQKLVNIICNNRKQSQFARLARSFIVGGVPGAVGTVAFTGVFSYLNEKRGVVDVHNFAASGAVAGGLMGQVLFVFPPGTRHRRVLSAMHMSVYTGVVCYPWGWACLKLLEKPRVYYIDDRLKQSKEGESEQCDEAAV